MNGRGPQVRRTGSHVRRTPVRHSSPSLGSTQILAIGLMTTFLAGIFAISISPTFAARTLEIHGAKFTSESIIRSIVGMDGAPNAFRIDSDRAAQQIVTLPAVESATVQVRLPSTVVVTVVERDPKLVWAIGDKRYVVDQDGLLFGLVDTAGNPIPSSAGPLASPTERPTATSSDEASGSDASASASPGDSASVDPNASPTKKKAKTPKPKATPTATPTDAASPSTDASGSAPPATYNPPLVPSLAPAPTADPAASSGPAALGLPVVFDRRESDAGLGLGGIVDPVNLDAGYRLAGLTPTDVGSKAAMLSVVLDDDHGFTVGSAPVGWVAEFGFYAPTVRKTAVIPEQVRDLRSLLKRYGEAHVAWVWLVADVSNNRYNTYLPR